MDIYPYSKSPILPKPDPINVKSRELPDTVLFAGDYGHYNPSLTIGTVNSFEWVFVSPNNTYPQGAWQQTNYGSNIRVKKLIIQEVQGGEPAVKGLKGNVNHDVINELSLAGVDYMQGNIFNQLFVQGALP